MPVWHGNLEGHDLDNLFGFIEAYVVCPPEISRPFLPYRDDKTQTLPCGKVEARWYPYQVDAVWFPTRAPPPSKGARQLVSLEASTRLYHSLEGTFWLQRDCGDVALRLVSLSS